jgi:hypothetical protein
VDVFDAATALEIELLAQLARCVELARDRVEFYPSAGSELRTLLIRKTADL